MGTMNCIVSHSTVICYRFFLKVCSKEHNLELFQITLWLASQVIKRGDGSITPVQTKKSSWTLLRMVMVERLVRIFLNEKYSYFLSQLFSTVMSGTTTNDMKHRFGHVVPKDAIIILSVLGSGRECPELFKNNTGMEINTEQCRRLFTRMKADEKQVHDELYLVYLMLNSIVPE